jgi:hypothetical protein
MHKFFILSLTAAVCGSFAAAQQVGCGATQSSIVGAYTFTATELPIAGTVVVPPGSTTNKQTYSSTPTGTLISSINGGGAFSQSGVLYFDGAGHVSISASSSPLGASAVIGTYTVNTDCTINVTLTDVFNTTAPGGGITTATQGTTSLIGLVLGGGTEIVLSVAQSATSTNGNTPLVPGEFASRLMIQLVRTFAYGCTVASLNGSYGLIGNGFLLVSATTAQPATVFARVNFDGAGNILPQIVPSGSPLASFQYMGTYTVNLDCSGTMTLSPVTTGTTTGATTPPSVKVNIVLIPPIAYLTGNQTTLPSGSAARPGIEFTLSSATQTLSGFGLPQ